MLIYATSIFAGGYQEITTASARLGFGGLALVLAFSLVNYLVRFGRWNLYCRDLGYSIPVRSNLAYYLAGFAFAVTPGKAGELVRPTYLKRHAVTYTHSIAALFAERFVDFLAIAGLATLIISYVEGLGGYLGVLTLMLLVSLLLTYKLAATSFSDEIAEKIPSKKLRLLTGTLLGLIGPFAFLLKPRVLLTGFGMGVLAWGAEGIGFYYIVRSLGINCPPHLAVGIYSVGLLAGAISFVPGATGRQPPKQSRSCRFWEQANQAQEVQGCP